ncbi:MAG TPA: hypothetical protein VMG58_03590 [Candidatus Sulfotelmatobacter sp.]|nr:hypothetical protein [Candidatus Sulfotelmatobacter sp.]
MRPIGTAATPLVRYSHVTRARRAANRANALKSTGPRTAAGKRHSSMNAWRHGWRTQARSSGVPDRGPEAQAFERFKRALRLAVLPAENALGENLLRRMAASTWKVKRNYDRWLAARTDEEFFLLEAGLRPRPGGWRVRLRCRDWWVTISVWVRRNRAPGSARLLPYLDPAMSGGMEIPARPVVAGLMDRPRQHTMVKVSCVRHPWFPDAGSRAVDVGAFNGLEEPAGPASEPEMATDERSHEVDEGKGVAKISRRQRMRMEAPYGIGFPGRREAEEEEASDPWCPPMKAPDAAQARYGRRRRSIQVWVRAGGGDEAPAAAARVTNEATRLQKAKGFKKYLGIPFWQNLARRALITLRPRPLGGGHSISEGGRPSLMDPRPSTGSGQAGAG